MSRESEFGKPPFPIKYCSRCCMPETNEGMQFDEMGICLACRSSEQKMHIDWAEREKDLKHIIDNYRSKDGSNYDCMVPSSGGKDSCFQLHILTKVYKLNPLVVTANHNWYSETGWRNLQNSLEIFDVDHIMFTPKRSTVNKCARASLYSIGDACWHCHTQVSSFPLHIAAKFGIKLLVYGESPAEFSGRATYLRDDNYDTENSDFVSDTKGNQNVFRSDPEHWLKNSAKVTADDMIGREGLERKDLIMFQMPKAEDLKKVGATGIFLGDYMFWDSEKQTEFLIKEYGWEEDDIEGTYKRYKSVECIMPGIHDYTKYLKRGFGRGSDFAAQDIRAGIITREEGFELAKKHDCERPGALDKYLEVTGYSEEEFYKIISEQRVAGLKDKGIDPGKGRKS